MQTVIKRLESIRNSCARLAASGGYPNFDFEAQEAEYSKALSILRSYPGAVQDEAEPTEPLPTIYVSFIGSGVPSWSMERNEDDEVAPDYVSSIAYRMLAEPDQGNSNAPLCAEMTAALARWKAEKVEAGVKLVAAYQVGMPMERKEADEPIAPEFTPPEMGGDPRYLHIWVTTLETMMFGATKDLVLNEKAEEAAIATFNILFPKP